MCPKATFSQCSTAFKAAGARPYAQVEGRLCLRKRLSSLCRRIQFPLKCCCHGPCQDGSGKATRPAAAAAVPADTRLSHSYAHMLCNIEEQLLGAGWQLHWGRSCSPREQGWLLFCCICGNSTVWRSPLSSVTENLHHLLPAEVWV